MITRGYLIGQIIDELSAKKYFQYNIDQWDGW